MALICRNVFAREELHRRIVKTTATCSWCGWRRHNGTLFAYRTETDGGRSFEHSGLFCRKSCHDAYHGR